VYSNTSVAFHKILFPGYQKETPKNVLVLERDEQNAGLLIVGGDFFS
jgi:hypothetical protein